MDYNFRKTMSRILYLTLKKKWFDLIASGEKTKEFREIKPFDSTQLEKFPLRVTFEKKGLLFTPRISYNDFDQLSRQWP